MRMVADGRAGLTDRMRRHLELCLDCRACETACPSGVRYGRLIEPFRLAVEQADRGRRRSFDWFRELILFRLFPYADRMRQAAGAGAAGAAARAVRRWPSGWGC